MLPGSGMFAVSLGDVPAFQLFNTMSKSSRPTKPVSVGSIYRAHDHPSCGFRRRESVGFGEEEGSVVGGVLAGLDLVKRVVERLAELYCGGVGVGCVEVTQVVGEILLAEEFVVGVAEFGEAVGEHGKQIAGADDGLLARHGLSGDAEGHVGRVLQFVDVAVRFDDEGCWVAGIDALDGVVDEVDGDDGHSDEGFIIEVGGRGVR